MQGAPPEGSPEELRAFARLQATLPDMFRRVARDPRTLHSAVVVPSLSLDPRELAKISGAHHYEERLLYHLMLLRGPRTHVVFVTSQPVDPEIIDYYLHLLTGVPASHARRRLTLLSCHDASGRPLSRKILERPRLQRRIREAIPHGSDAHLVCFNSTPLERTLAVRLGIPLYAADPALSDLGTKSGCREVFREAGVPLPDGFERLRDEDDIVEALDGLKARNPSLRKAVVKLNEGFSGEGNAVFRYDGCPERGRRAWIRERLPRLVFAAPTETWPGFLQKFREMGGVVEAFVDGSPKASPSTQTRVTPTGEAQVISTHDQVLGGPDGQVFEGCTFPAHPDYRLEIQELGLRVARVLASRGVIGRFATDFVSVRGAEGWQHYAIEVNLRKGGTTHPFLTLKFLTDGHYDTERGEFRTPAGNPKCYFASDTLVKPHYVGLTPTDLIDISVYHNLHFHAAAERGVVFHLMGALSEFGKIGVLCIGDNLQQARFLYRRTVDILDREARGLPQPSPPPGASNAVTED